MTIILREKVALNKNWEKVSFSFAFCLFLRFFVFFVCQLKPSSQIAMWTTVEVE